MNFIRNFLNTSDSQDLVTIPAGVFYLKRSPDSVKGQSECLFKDAVAILRKTSAEYNYQLAIQRVFEEGEEALEGNEDDENDDGALSDSEDEWAFLLDESLHLTYNENPDGQVVIIWRDLDGEPGDHFEFVCDSNTKPKLFDQFDITARRCQYERKFQKSYEKATDDDLEAFEFEPDPVTILPEHETIVYSPKSKTETPRKSIASSAQSTPSKSRKSVTVSTPVKTIKQESSPSTPASKSTPPSSSSPSAGVAKTPAKKVQVKTPPVTPAKQMDPPKPKIEKIETVEGTELYKSTASLHLFDAPTGVFVEQLSKAKVIIYDQGKYEYWLEVDDDKNRFIGMQITSEMNPVFNYEHLSFIFNFFTEDSAFSWLLKFGAFEELETFQSALMQSLWESNNKAKWSKVKPDEREFLVDAFQDFNMEDIEEEDEDEDEFYDAEEEEETKRGIKKGSSLQYGDGNNDYDDDEEDDEDTKKRMTGKGINKELAVGHVNDRTYVLRDNMLGVFKQTKDDDLEFQTTIEGISDLKGKALLPNKVMLHTQDRSMIIQDNNNLGSLYRMDLEYGKVVDEWKVSDSHQIRAFAPTQKYAQGTDEQTIVGASDTGIFKIDPRLSGTKLVDGQLKNYATKMKFSAMATTDKGHLAVANSKGEIRLYDRLGINAKTHLPAMGDPIIGIDVSADGKWILATCSTYLLLIDASQEGGKTGFVKSFGKDVKPRPKRLQISPEHLAQMQMETGKPLSFTISHFNTGLDTKEQTIVTSSGPFVITWSIKKLVRGDKTPYLIQRYSDIVTAENFKYGTDKNVIIALADDVGMVDRRTFRKPTRESLATPARRIQAMSRNSVVNSPF